MPKCGGAVRLSAGKLRAERTTTVKREVRGCLRMTWLKPVVPYFKAIFEHFSGETQEVHSVGQDLISNAKQ